MKRLLKLRYIVVSFSVLILVFRLLEKRFFQNR